MRLCTARNRSLGAVVNISTTGLLLETDADLEPGQHVIISIDMADEDEPLAVKAEVVRRADPERDGVALATGLRHWLGLGTRME